MGRDVDPNNVWRRHARCSVSKEYSSGGVHSLHNYTWFLKRARVCRVSFSTCQNTQQIGWDLEIWDGLF